MPHLTPFRMDCTKTKQRTNTGEVVEKGEHLCPVYRMSISIAMWETMWRFLNKLKIELYYDLAAPLLGIHPKEIESAHPCLLDQCLQQLKYTN